MYVRPFFDHLSLVRYLSLFENAHYDTNIPVHKYTHIVTNSDCHKIKTVPFHYLYYAKSKAVQNDAIDFLMFQK